MNNFVFVYHYFGSFVRNEERFTFEGVTQLPFQVMEAEHYIKLKQAIVALCAYDRDPPLVDEIAIESLSFLGATVDQDSFRESMN